jgi:phospholipase C
VIFQENVSFDHYFGTYPNAANLPGERTWVAGKNTPTVNGLTRGLLTHNPNEYNPVRLNRAQSLTCDQNHEYTAELKAQDGGLMDKFVQNTTGSAGSKYQYCPKNIVMGYYDGNVVTGLWNYAQHFALNDNSYGTNFGPSTPGAVNLISGDTGTVRCGPSGAVINAPACTSTPPVAGGSVGTVYSDADPYYDICSNGAKPVPSKDIAMSGPNIGTKLSQAHVSWGWFQGGFGDCFKTNPVSHGPVLALKAQGVPVGQDKADWTTDYSPHHEPFQYYASTANPKHLPPTSIGMVGNQDRANHQYDINWFWRAADANNLPAVTFLKAPRYQDGHAGYSSPLDEQYFLASTINHLESLKTWKSTAVVIAYDDSDGWYDHVFGTILNQSSNAIDAGLCGTTPTGTQPGRCGYGPRLPLLVISPYAKSNFVDNTLTDQSSILRFIEDNWLGGSRISSESFDRVAGPLNNMFDFTNRGRNRSLYLNPLTGTVIR